MKDSLTDSHAFHLPHKSQFLRDVQSFALWKAAGKEEKVTSIVAP